MERQKEKVSESLEGFELLLVFPPLYHVDSKSLSTSRILEATPNRNLNASSCHMP